MLLLSWIKCNKLCYILFICPNYTAVYEINYIKVFCWTVMKLAILVFHFYFILHVTILQWELKILMPTVLNAWMDFLNFMFEFYTFHPQPSMITYLWQFTENSLLFDITRLDLYSTFSSLFLSILSTTFPVSLDSFN